MSSTTTFLPVLGRPVSPANPPPLSLEGAFRKRSSGLWTPRPPPVNTVCVDHGRLDAALGEFAPVRAGVKQEETANPLNVSLLGLTDNKIDSLNPGPAHTGLDIHQSSSLP